MKEIVKEIKKEINRGTLVICDYLRPRSAFGIVQAQVGEKFLIKIVWPETEAEVFHEMPREAFDPICNNPDDAREILGLREEVASLKRAIKTFSEFRRDARDLEGFDFEM